MHKIRYKIGPSSFYILMKSVCVYGYLRYIFPNYLFELRNTVNISVFVIKKKRHSFIHLLVKQKTVLTCVELFILQTVTSICLYVFTTMNSMFDFICFDRILSLLYKLKSYLDNFVYNKLGLTWKTHYNYVHHTGE